MKRFLAVAVVAILALPATALAQKQHGAAKAAPVAAKIANAETAAPAEISSHATIMDYPSKAGGALVKLRAGTNGWVCLPDDPATQGNDPGCFDGVWQEWMKAFMAKTKPTITRVGVSYMTAPGGASASAKDPWAAKATPTNDWGFDGPHTMILVPNTAQLAGLPTTRKPGEPYVMWAGTPYAHIMVPMAAR